MAKIDIDGDGKPDLHISMTQIVGFLSMFGSLIGTYYTLKNQITTMEQKIERAMEMPKQEISKKDFNAMEREFDLKLSKIERQAEENMNDIKFIESNYKRNR